MIPIGAPVTVTWMNGEKEAGIVSNHREFYGWSVKLQPWLEVKVTVSGKPTTFPADKVKIRYNSPAPFTLWQLNVLAQEDANDKWKHEFQQLAPDDIPLYWEWSTFKLVETRSVN